MYFIHKYCFDLFTYLDLELMIEFGYSVFRPTVSVLLLGFESVQQYIDTQIKNFKYSNLSKFIST